MAVATTSGGDGGARVCSRESQGRGWVEEVSEGFQGVRGVSSQLQAVGGKQEEAWRARRCRGVPPLPTGRGRR